MKTSESRRGSIAVISIEGEIDLASSPELRRLLRAHADAKQAALVLDFAAVQYVDSSGLATLVEYLRDAAAYGGRLAVASPSQRVRSVFELVRLDSLIPLHPSLEAAEAALVSS